MEENQDFIQQLDDSLRAKRTQLEENVIGKLREDLHSFGSNFYTIYTYLVQKGYLKKDLYNYDQKSKMEPPSSEPISDAEMIPELSFRFASYNSVLEFLNNMFQIDIDKLNLNGIKQILAIVNYVNWDSVSSNTTHPVTRAFSLVLEKITPSNNDPMSSEIKFNLMNIMGGLYKDIRRSLKNISIYQRELYKFKVRSLFMTEDKVTADMVNKDRKGTLLNIKMEMTSLLPDEPFYRELIEEALDEDFGFDIEKKRAAVLERLKISNKVVKKKEKKEPEITVDKKDLIKIIPDLAKAGDQLSSALAKLEHNKEITSAKRKSFSEILRKFFTRKETEIFYDIRTTDPLSGQTKKEKINYNDFSNTTRKKVLLLRSLNNTRSPQYAKIKDYQEDTLYSFLENSLIELRSFHKRLMGLDEMFKKEEDQAIRTRIRGIKVETDTIKRIYMECSKDLKEYSAKKEELAQLKALGINQ
jgi:hypothetical protein